MVRLNNNKTKIYAIRCWWTNYIYWIPTVMTELHLLSNSCLTSINIKDKFNGEGNNFSISINILGLVIVIDYWWNVTEKTIN